MRLLKQRSALWCGLISLFVIWHIGALLIAPAPPSDLVRKFYPAFRPYLSWLWLHTEWSLFGPDPDPGRMLRAHLVGANGETHTLALTESLRWRDPAYFRLTTLYNRIHPSMPENITAGARYLAGQHRDWNVREVRFEIVRQMTMRPEWYLKGERPLDPDYLESVPLDPEPIP